jgi:hypothetical protein
MPERPAVLLVTHQPEVAREADHLYRLCDGRLHRVAAAGPAAGPAADATLHAVPPYEA